MNGFTKIGLTNKTIARSFLILLYMALMTEATVAQIRRPHTPRPSERRPEPGVNQAGPGNDSTGGFEHRDDLADSITIYYRFLDSLTTNKLDSSINDYGRIYSVPTGYVTLGNNGSAAFPIFFSPEIKSGWDPGFHAFDVYKYTIDNTKFYQTTRPYTLLSYLLGSEKEQVVGVLHTQNIRPNWNAGFDYRLISSPGIFQTQNTSHNNYRLFSTYQGKRKRYTANLVILANQLSASENGGIQDISSLADPNLKRRIAVPVRLADNSNSGNQIFSTKIVTGNKQNDFAAFFRQSYDLGKKDSVIINDSTTNYLFYPKLRFQHTLQYSTFANSYEDPMNKRGATSQDSAFYSNNYNIQFDPGNGFYLQLHDRWKVLTNDFVIRQFPETKNTGQFIEVGARLENYSGEFSSFKIPDNILQIYPPPSSFTSFLNVVLHGEYRNKTRNKKWDALLKGDFYTAGFNAGDFYAQAMLTRFLNKKLGDIQVSFQNTNRTPSYIFNGHSAFDLDTNSLTKKENITILNFRANNPRFTLVARNISIANYTYFKDFYHSDQFSGLLNLTQISLSTVNKIRGHLNLYSDFILQQSAGQNPLRVPLFYTRQRLAFEGNFFKNLNLSTGLDVSYNTPYKANNYSPLMGAFFPQDSITISNLPKVNAFFNFRIKSFTAYITAENLNTFTYDGGLMFLNNNFSAPFYPTSGFMLRFGLQWGFVN